MNRKQVLAGIGYLVAVYAPYFFLAWKYDHVVSTEWRLNDLYSEAAFLVLLIGAIVGAAMLEKLAKQHPAPI